jgi:hypothetical protein
LSGLHLIQNKLVELVLRLGAVEASALHLERQIMQMGY